MVLSVVRRSRSRAPAPLVAALALALAGPASTAVARSADTTPPVIDSVRCECFMPYQYSTITFVATAHDDESGVAALTWQFSDGLTATGAAVSRAVDTSGTLTATVTATDAAGNTSTASTDVTVLANPYPPEPAYVEPDLDRVRLRPGRISARGLTPGVPRRTRLAFRVLDSVSTARITVDVRGAGGLRARRVLGDLRNGRHRVRLGAQVGDTALPPGHYRVVVRASNDYGSETSTVRLRIVP